MNKERFNNCSPRNIQIHGAKVTPSGIKAGVQGCQETRF